MTTPSGRARVGAFVLSRIHGRTLEQLLTSGTTTLHVLGGDVRGTAGVHDGALPE